MVFDSSNLLKLDFWQPYYILLQINGPFEGHKLPRNDFMKKKTNKQTKTQNPQPILFSIPFFLFSKSCSSKPYTLFFFTHSFLLSHLTFPYSSFFLVIFFCLLYIFFYAGKIVILRSSFYNELLMTMQLVNLKRKNIFPLAEVLSISSSLLFDMKIYLQRIEIEKMLIIIQLKTTASIGEKILVIYLVITVLIMKLNATIFHSGSADNCFIIKASLLT